MDITKLKPYRVTVRQVLVGGIWVLAESEEDADEVASLQEDFAKEINSNNYTIRSEVTPHPNQHLDHREGHMTYGEYLEAIKPKPNISEGFISVTPMMHGKDELGWRTEDKEGNPIPIITKTYQETFDEVILTHQDYLDEVIIGEKKLEDLPDIDYIAWCVELLGGVYVVYRLKDQEANKSDKIFTYYSKEDRYEW